jgi:hypothetical protein
MLYRNDELNMWMQWKSKLLSYKLDSASYVQFHCLVI